MSVSSQMLWGIVIGVLIVPALVVISFAIHEARRSAAARDGFLLILGSFAAGILVGVVATNVIRGW